MSQVGSQPEEAAAASLNCFHRDGRHVTIRMAQALEREIANRMLLTGRAERIYICVLTEKKTGAGTGAELTGWEFCLRSACRATDPDTYRDAAFTFSLQRLNGKDWHISLQASA